MEVQVDDGPWRAARLHRHFSQASGSREFAWRFWTLNWGKPAQGEHAIRSRAYGEDGNVQPSPDDPYLTSRRTFWENNGHVTRRVLIP